MIKFKRLVLACLCLVAFHSMAGYELKDPKGILDQIRVYFPEDNLSSGLPCGDWADYTRNTSQCVFQCNATTCVSTCYSINLKEQLIVDECSKDEVWVFGTEGSMIHVHQKDFGFSANTWLSSFLNDQLGSYISPNQGEVVIQSYSIQSYTYISGGKIQSVDGIRIFCSFHPGWSFAGEACEIDLSPGFQGLKRFLGFSIGSSHVFLKLRGIIYEN